jgi:peptidoglycan hydrolase CwlO-like protein
MAKRKAKPDPAVEAITEEMAWIDEEVDRLDKEETQLLGRIEDINNEIDELKENWNRLRNKRAGLVK